MQEALYNNRDCDIKIVTSTDYSKGSCFQCFSILIELLGMNIHPNSLHVLLKDICSRHGKERTSRTDSRAKSKRPSEKPTDTKNKT